MGKSEKEIRAYIIGGEATDIPPSESDIRYIIEGKRVPKPHELAEDSGNVYNSLLTKISSIANIFTASEWKVLNEMIRSYENSK